MKNHSILLMFHCSQGTGYAIKSLEHVFYSAACKAGYSDNQIYWSFNGTKEKSNFIIDCDYHKPDADYLTAFIKTNSIKKVIAFDLGYPSSVLAIMRNAGVTHIISYWGASMSGINSGLRLLIKKIEWTLRRDKPDFFVFESKAMQYTATHGRGIPLDKTSVIHLGVDTAVFTPSLVNNTYTHDVLDIPYSRKLVFYSGHMEPRKGVHVIVDAAKQLAKDDKIRNIHFVICGNKGNEADPFIAMLKESPAASHVTFAGYRNDIEKLMQSCHLGVIASTGWDSFTLSSVEMMASGLPLIVSNLQGLSETIMHETNGYLFEPGNHIVLAQQISELCEDDEKRKKFSIASRSRALQYFDVNNQIGKMSELLNG